MENCVDKNDNGLDKEVSNDAIAKDLSDFVNKAALKRNIFPKDDSVKPVRKECFSWVDSNGIERKAEASSNLSFIPRLDNVLVKFTCHTTCSKVFLGNENAILFTDITIAGVGERVAGLKVGDRVRVSSAAVREPIFIMENKNTVDKIKNKLKDLQKTMCIGQTINLLPELVKEYGIKTFGEYLAKEGCEVTIYQLVRDANIIGVDKSDSIIDYARE